MNPPELGLVLFDLDGTLVDTAPDMAAALNRVLEDEGQAPLAQERIRPHVSHGGMALIRLGFGERLPPARFERLRQRFLGHYRARLHERSGLFEGVEGLLAAIAQRGMHWGVVTNKPAWLTTPLLDHLGLTAAARCVVSGDTLPERKPHPAPLLHACERCGTPPPRTLYVGDAERDILAGRAAGMRTVVAAYGYLGPQDRWHDWQADAVIQHPRELLALLPLPTRPSLALP